MKRGAAITWDEEGHREPGTPARTRHSTEQIDGFCRWLDLVDTGSLLRGASTADLNPDDLTMECLA